MPYADARYGRPMPEWLNGVDWVALNKQKRLLASRIWDDSDSELWGIVNLFDAMQDWAVGSGYKAEAEVFNADIED